MSKTPAAKTHKDVRVWFLWSSAGWRTKHVQKLMGKVDTARSLMYSPAVKAQTGSESAEASLRTGLNPNTVPVICGVISFQTERNRIIKYECIRSSDRNGSFAELQPKSTADDLFLSMQELTASSIAISTGRTHTPDMDRIFAKALAYLLNALELRRPELRILRNDPWSLWPKRWLRRWKIRTTKNKCPMQAMRTRGRPCS